MNKQKTLFITSAGLAIIVIINACGPSQAELDATATQAAVAMFATQTAEAPTATLTPTNTLTPTSKPTDTPTSTPTAMPTNTPNPTNTPTTTPDLTETAAVAATQQAEEFLSEIEPVLQAIGYSTDDGYLGWVSDGPTSITIDSYSSYSWRMVDPFQEFSNFILRADMTWESTSGLILCGFVFRAGGIDLPQTPYYLFQTIRLSGMPAWDVEYWKFGQLQSNITGGVREDAAINQDQGSTNEFLMVVDGNTFKAYVNHENLGGATISTLESGLLGFYAWQESGETTCTFDNAWAWVLE